MATTDEVNSNNYVNISKSSISNWKNFSDNCFNLLRNYQFLTDSYVLDFFSEDLWQSVPPLWGEALQSFTPQQLSALLYPPSQSSESNRIGAVLPLSFLAFCSATFACSLPREAVTSPSPFLQYMKQRCSTSTLLNDEENTNHCVLSKAKPIRHVNFTDFQTNYVCSIPSYINDIGSKSQTNQLCSNSKIPIHIGSLAEYKGFHSVSTQNSPSELQPIDGTTDCCICCTTPDTRSVEEACQKISYSKSYGEAGNVMSACSNSNHCTERIQIEPARSKVAPSTVPLVCDELGNKGKRLNHGTLHSSLSSHSELHYCKEEIIPNKIEESYDAVNLLPNCNSNRKESDHQHSAMQSLNNGDTKTKLFFKDRSSAVRRTEHELLDSIVNGSNTETVYSQQTETISTESSARISLSNLNNMDMQRKLQWTSNKTKEMVPAWPATNVDSIVWGTSDSELTKAGGQHRLLSHVFRRHVKPKKQHEVARLSLIASLASATARCDVTSDVGSGCGHLARLMAYGHRLRVVCVDKEEDFVKGARQFDDQLEKSMSKLQRRRPILKGTLTAEYLLPQQQQVVVKDDYQLPAGPRHAACLLQLGGDAQSFAETVLSRWKDHPTTHSSLHPTERSIPQATGCGHDDNVNGSLTCRHSEPEHESNCVHEMTRLGLTGLHTCGDLAATLLDVFLRAPQCRYLASVACCYMKLSTPQEAQQEGTPPGYPLSQHSLLQPHHRLSYAARELACHAIEAYRERLMLGADNLKVHCYRAALEAIIVQYWPHHKRAGLRSVKNAHTKPFPEYAVSAVSAVEDGRLQLPEADLTSSDTVDRLNRWRQVVVFYTLRLLLAPVIESVLLLDRSFYLYEQGVDSMLVPTFDPKLSPRNVVLLAIKTNEQ